MGMIGDGKVVVIVTGNNSVGVDLFGSVKELIQHFITRYSIVGAWGSQEQLAALRETKELLDRTVELVAAEVAAEEA